jgi:uncharacterized OB-fold protein
MPEARHRDSTDGTGADDAVVVEGRWDFHYTYFAGSAASRFFAGLRERRILGSPCPKCGAVRVPARGFCDACFVETPELVDVGQSGTLEAFTILSSSFPGLPDPPVVVGYVLLEGASSAVLNFVDGVDLSDIDVAGARLLRRPKVRVRFRDRCEGRITDFAFVLDGAS